MGFLNFILLIVAIGSSWMLLFQISLPNEKRQDDNFTITIVSTVAWACLLVQII